MKFNDVSVEFSFFESPFPMSPTFRQRALSEAVIIDTVLTLAYPDNDITREVNDACHVFTRAGLPGNDQDTVNPSVQVLRGELPIIDAALAHLSKVRTMHEMFLEADIG